MNKLNSVALALLITIFTTAVYANIVEHNHSINPENVAEAKISVERKLISIYKNNKKLTMNHKAIENIGGQPMIIRFSYEDENMIKDLQESDE
ncbi:hypothetical protein MASR2M36_10250 [Providencia sp.]